MPAPRFPAAPSVRDERCASSSSISNAPRVPRRPVSPRTTPPARSRTHSRVRARAHESPPSGRRPPPPPPPPAPRRRDVTRPRDGMDHDQAIRLALDGDVTTARGSLRDQERLAGAVSTLASVTQRVGGGDLVAGPGDVERRLACRSRPRHVPAGTRISAAAPGARRAHPRPGFTDPRPGLAARLLFRPGSTKAMRLQ